MNTIRLLFIQSRIRLHARKPPSRTTQQPACAEPLPTYPNPRNACRKFHRNLRGVRGPMTTNQTRPAHCVQNMVPRRSGSSWSHSDIRSLSGHSPSRRFRALVFSRSKQSAFYPYYKPIKTCFPSKKFRKHPVFCLSWSIATNPRVALRPSYPSVVYSSPRFSISPSPGFLVT